MVDAGGDKIVVRFDPKKSDEEIITVLRFGRYADHSFLYVRYQDGAPREMDEMTNEIGQIVKTHSVFETASL